MFYAAKPSHHRKPFCI